MSEKQSVIEENDAKCKAAIASSLAAGAGALALRKKLKAESKKK